MDSSPSSSTSGLSDPPSSDPPSSPLSVLTKSPSISPRMSFSFPNRLPTPPSSSIFSGSASPMRPPNDTAEPELEIHVNPDGPPPAKRRRVERKPRTTETLDLSAASEQSPRDEELLDQLTTALRKKKKIIIIAGAGISVSAGIPDFRSSTGLFATSGKHLFDASVYKTDSSTDSFHTMVREMSHIVRNAEPTPFHHFLASLAKEGRLLRLYTQNVDGLDTSMPPLGTNVPLQSKGPWPQTIQLHGCLDKMVCSKCNDISEFDPSLFDGPQAPLCKGCEETDNVRTSHAGKRSHGIGRLRPRMVLYNEYNPDQEAISNVVRADMRARPDAVIVVGTSLKIPGVKNIVKDMCKITRERRDGITAWINLEAEPSGAEFKDCWDLIVRGKCDDVASLVHLPHYDESIEQGAETLVDDENYESHIRRVKVEVEIRGNGPNSVKTEELRKSPSVEAKLQSIVKVQGIPTPSASPRIRSTLPAKPVSQSKQTRLSFASRISKANSAAGVKGSKKPAPRKSRQSKKNPIPKPKATINSTFKASKSSVVIDSKFSAKRPFDESPTSHVQSARSLLLNDFSLRPRGPKPVEETFIAQKSPDSVSQGRPCTPTEQMGERLAHKSTVSPPSKPRGMGSLID